MSSDEDKVVKVTKGESTTIYRETSVDVSKDHSTTTHIMTNDDESLKIKAQRAGDSVIDLVGSALDKAVDTAKAKTNELLTSGALEPGYAVAKKDSADIARLGSPMVTDLAIAFEDTITMIRTHPYEEQVQILTGYKKLLEAQINVINSRIHFVKRVH